MADFSTVMTEVENRFHELEPFDRYAQLNRFWFKAEKERCGLIPFQAADSPAGDPLVLQEHALKQLCTRTGVPFVFFKKCPQVLREYNVAWFMQHLESEKNVMFRMVRGNQVRAILSDRYAPFDDIELFKILADFMDGTEKVIFQDFSDASSHVRIIWHSQAEEIQPGDVVEQGLHIANSEVGLRSVTILGIIHRLKCKNGLVAREKVGGFRHIGDPERIRSHVQQVLEDVKHDSERLMVKFKKSLEQQLDRPLEVINKLAEDHDLTKEEYEAILNSFMTEPSKSLFGVVNAVSNAAQRSPDADRRFEMETLASNILDNQLAA